MENLFKPQIIKTLTHEVKNNFVGAQLQAFRSWKTPVGSWVYEFRFFPGPKKGLLLGWESESSRRLCVASLETSEQAAEAKRGWDASPDPLQLYVRAHALNLRVEEWIGSEDSQNGILSLELRLTGDVRLIWEQERPRSSELRVKVLRPGAKDFTRRVELGALQDGSPETSVEKAGPELEKATSSKFLRLLSKVQSDVDESLEGLGHLQELCVFLEGDPQAWGRSEAWPETVSRALEWVRGRSALPSFQASTRAAAQDLIYGLRRRYQRKLQGAQRRLAEVAEGASAARSSAGPAQGAKLPSKDRRPKGSGLWLAHPSGLKARLGRSQSENADLYREASARDLWFHVRGLGGAHVWIPRGQALFGGKQEELRDDLELWACQLAVFNFKARHAGYGVVDITEKRHLRSARGSEGTLLIQRSKTRLAELDANFEAWAKNSGA